MRKTLGCLLFLLVFYAQDATAQRKAAITNTDIAAMAKAGIDENTIISVIQQGPTQFDTSPAALIQLKNAGLSDLVLSAMLAANKRILASEPNAGREAGEALFRQVIEAMGPSDAIAAIKTVCYTASQARTRGTATTTFDRKYTKRYPDALSIRLTAANGQVFREVITEQFGYRSSGTVVTATDAEVLASFRQQTLFDSIYIAQHPSDYEAELLPGSSPTGVQWLKISRAGTSITWTVDGRSNSVISTTLPGRPEGEKIDFSDYRQVSGVMIPFKRRSVEQGGTEIVTTIKEYEINPTLDPALFDQPSTTTAQPPVEGLRIKVLQAESVPYVQESGGGISTKCSIVGSSNTSGMSNTFGNTTFGNSTTTSDLHMNCNSYDTTVRWPHVLNTMFVQASDGNAYIIACDRAWRWSKCVPLRSGDIFNARMTDKGIEVEAFNLKGKESNPTYRIIQSRSQK